MDNSDPATKFIVADRDGASPVNVGVANGSATAAMAVVYKDGDPLQAFQFDVDSLSQGVEIYTPWSLAADFWLVCGHSETGAVASQTMAMRTGRGTAVTDRLAATSSPSTGTGPFLFLAKVRKDGTAAPEVVYIQETDHASSLARIRITDVVDGEVEVVIELHNSVTGSSTLDRSHGGPMSGIAGSPRP